MTEELKPCPWCGDPLTVVNVVEGDTFRWRRVQGCCADGPEVRHDTMADDQAAAEVESHAAAIAAWNTRPGSNALALLSLIADIRKSAGDAEGRLMQSELVEHIAALRAEAERYRHLRAKHVQQWESDMDHDRGAPSLSIDFDAPGHDLDAAIDAARAAK